MKIVASGGEGEMKNFDKKQYGYQFAGFEGL